MAEERLERRLSAILAADIAGYSALMGADEARTVRDLKGHQAIVLPMIGEFGGRIIDTAGDGILAEFPSVVNAVTCAVAIQSKMAERNAAIEPQRRMQFRVGINIGEVVHDEARIYGDGVNIAARLESLAAPGGICLSRQAHEQVDGKLPLSYRELGPQTLKNIPKPVEVFAVETDVERKAQIDPRVAKQEIKYCRTLDGVRLAYSKVGRGPPLVKTANWMNHVELDWEGSVLSHLFLALARNRTLVRYDARGNGLSDWEVETVSLDAWVSDLETVLDAAGVDRAPLLGMSQGCAISVAFAVRHPGRVSHLLLYGGFARGAYRRAKDEPELQKAKALATLIRTGWGDDSPIYRQLFSSLFMPGGTTEQLAKFAERQRKTTSPECAYRYFETTRNLDVTDLLPQVKVPTLVMHVRGDQVQPFEAGRELAAGIPGAHFVALPGQNHIPLEQDPTSARILEEIDLFLKR
jgi:class 3 adenylate cyclase/pimeloyl-ACP methyl ester carboxylesterase